MGNTLPKPILAKINIFVPSEDTIIDFEYSGNQIESKRLVITNNDTFEVVYDNTLLGMKLNYTLSKNSIPVGQYTAKIMVTDFDGNTSPFSDSVMFYCYSKPTFVFNNITKVVNSSKINLSILYSQEENEPLKEFMFYLYDYQKNLLKQSDYFYGTSVTDYTFIGLKDKFTYYVRCVGRTSHDMIVDTGYYEISVQYIVQPNNMILNLENVKCEGYISINCNILDLGYDVVGDYEIKDGEVTLPIGSSVTYNSGFDFSDEFSMFVKARKVPLDSPLFKFSTTDGIAKLSIINVANMYYAKLSVYSPLNNYVLYTKLPKAGIADSENNLIVDTFDNYIEQVNLDYEDVYITVFEIKRKNNLYSLKVYYEDNGVILTE